MRENYALVDVGSVLHTGRELELREAMELPPFSGFAFGRPVDVALLIRRVGGGISVDGTLAGIASGECARCLDPVNLPVSVDVGERLDPAGDRDDPLGENNVFTGDRLDVRDLVRQMIDSALPMVLLCGDDCPGLCPLCGEKTGGSCRCAHQE